VCFKREFFHKASPVRILVLKLLLPPQCSCAAAFPFPLRVYCIISGPSPLRCAANLAGGGMSTALPPPLPPPPPNYEGQEGPSLSISISITNALDCYSYLSCYRRIEATPKRDFSMLLMLSTGGIGVWNW
jgi:hypothetical protein